MVTDWVVRLAMSRTPVKWVDESGLPHHHEALLRSHGLINRTIAPEQVRNGDIYPCSAGSPEAGWNLGSVICSRNPWREFTLFTR